MRQAYKNLQTYLKDLGKAQLDLAFTAIIAPTDGVIDDSALAKSMLSQAEQFVAEAARLQEQAYEMDPSLKPKRGRKKETAE